MKSDEVSTVILEVIGLIIFILWMTHGLLWG